MFFNVCKKEYLLTAQCFAKLASSYATVALLTWSGTVLEVTSWRLETTFFKSLTKIKDASGAGRWLTSSGKSKLKIKFQKKYMAQIV